jgi:hypothetical protein
MDIDFEREWAALLKKLNSRFGGEMDIQAVLFLIGIQELGKGRTELSKDQKMDVMHIAICRLLSKYGYYEFEGIDIDGWPHWKATAKLPHLKPGQQHEIMKQAIVEYFKENELAD